MRAADHTRRMLRWWADAGIVLADLAVRRSNGMMLWHHALPLDRLPLAWARAENARRGDVYIRPARGWDWPLVFLDDLPPRVALAAARKYAALAVETSARGGCHVWLACVRPLDERARRDAQRWLAQRTGADPASTSGEHLGRLAGLKNCKRGGVWVNVLVASHGHGWEPSPALPSMTPAATEQPRHSARAGTPAGDSSESAWEWGWVRRLLATGHDPQIIYKRLLARARPRRGRDAERYARRTVERAVLGR